tara:strand:- start:55 stop:726 length:672 start_codon:yes stop_codon:yes gene_type:complete
MTNYFKFLNSTLGKKIQIAFSGILLCVFLLFHLMNNLTLFAGQELFNNMVQTLESIKPIIRIMEFGLLAIISMHIFNALYLTINNKKATPDKYGVQPNQTSSLNSRTMIVSGIIILLFFIIHLRYLWYTFQVHAFGDNETYYSVIMREKLGYLGHTPTAIFYIIAILFIAWHLKHGFQSALKTFGILEKTKWGILYKISILFWGIIPLAFILIIICIQVGVIK